MSCGGDIQSRAKQSGFEGLRQFISTQAEMAAMLRALWSLHTVGTYVLQAKNYELIFRLGFMFVKAYPGMYVRIHIS